MSTDDNLTVSTLRALQEERSYVLCCLDLEHKFDYKRVKHLYIEGGSPYQFIFEDSVEALRKTVESRLFNIPNNYRPNLGGYGYPWRYNLANVNGEAMFAYDLSGLRVSIHKDVVVNESDFHYYEETSWGPFVGLIADNVPSLISVLNGDSLAQASSQIRYELNSDFPYKAYYSSYDPTYHSGKFFYSAEAFWSKSDVILTL